MPASVTLSQIRTRLRSHEPTRVAGNPAARASVALILRERDVTELLLIQRATRASDPWSGHMALPGGRRSPLDRDVIHTAVRETYEEVGIDVEGDGELIGTLDELPAVARRKPLELVISPTVWTLHTAAEPIPHAPEVAATLWVPLSFLYSERARAVYRRTLDGVEEAFPAYQFEAYTIWGLTHRILTGFLELIG